MAQFIYTMNHRFLLQATKSQGELIKASHIMHL